MPSKILNGDCLEIMRGLEENSIDTVITDPPYGLEFMGKDWDKFAVGRGKKYKSGGKMADVSMPGTGFTKLPSYTQRPAKRCSLCGKQDWSGSPCKCNEPKWVYDNSPLLTLQDFTESWAKECLRVAKPGATMLCFGGTRTYHRMAVAIEDAGWILKDCIMWLYGSGFPKATDISKQLDKGAGKEPKVIGKRTDGRYGSSFQETNNQMGQLNPKKSNVEKIGQITEPTTPEAKLWNGWKSHGLKPAYEPILVAMKPNDGTYANNALKHGVSGLNIDGGRIGTEDNLGRICTPQKEKTSYSMHDKTQYYDNSTGTGRFPANILLDEEAGAMLDEQSGERASGGGKKGVRGGIFGDGSENPDRAKSLYNDKGGASRFFYCAKSSKRERNNGLDCTLTVKYHTGICKEENMVAVELLKKVTYDTEIVSFSIDESGENITAQCHKDSLSTILTGTNKIIESKTLNSLRHFITNGFIQGANSEKDIGGNPAENAESLSRWLQITTKENLESARGVSNAVLQTLSSIKEKENWKPLTNIHSTVKPLALMEYLCTLTKTPTGGVILDPFAGSGTTLIAAKKTGRDFIGIEREKEYIDIAEARLSQHLQGSLTSHA